jgi:tRNA(Ile)-lysidine synthase
LPELADRLASDLEAFLRGPAGVSTGARIVVAFSGGPDSTALLLGLRRVARELPLDALAVHVDHGLDAGSGARAQRARELASSLGFGIRVRAGRVRAERLAAEGIESAARALRYGLLEEVRLEENAAWILTAHHRDDQLETVLLRLSGGTGLRGLGAMGPIRGRIGRPLLEWRRADLARVLAEEGVRAVDDPTNRDLSRPRNRLRHQLLPARPGWTEPILGVARAARAARERLDHRLASWIRPTSRGPAVARDRLAALAPVLQTWVLALLHEAAQRPHPPPANAVEELRRQLAARGRVGVDCGSGWRWVDAGGAVRLCPPGAEPVPFAYTLEVPGAVELREIGRRLCVERQPVEGWMWQGRPERAALGLPFDESGTVEVRSRRPGDRLRPLGSGHERRLKEILIDRKIPSDERNRLPLLCVGDQVAWVPGVTIHDDYRLTEDDDHAWVASLEPSP